MVFWAYSIPIFSAIYIALKLVWYKTLSFYSWSEFLPQPTPTFYIPSYSYLPPTPLPLPSTQPYLFLPTPTSSYLPPTPTYPPTHTSFLPLPPVFSWLPTPTSYLPSYPTSFLPLPPTYPTHHLLLFCHIPLTTSTSHCLYLLWPFVFPFISTVFTSTFDNWSPLDHLTYPLPYLHLSLPFLSTLSFHYTASSPPQLLLNFLWFILLFFYYLLYVLVWVIARVMGSL